MKGKKSKGKGRTTETRRCFSCKKPYEWQKDNFDDLGCCCEGCRTKMVRYYNTGK
jgi:hypothetical protein